MHIITEYTAIYKHDIESLIQAVQDKIDSAIGPCAWVPQGGLIIYTVYDNVPWFIQLMVKQKFIAVSIHGEQMTIKVEK